MAYEFDKASGRVIETKPAVKSLTLWSSSLTIAVGLIQIFPEIATEVLPLLSPQVAGIVTVVSGVIVVLRRAYAENLPVKGIISDQ